MAGVGKIPTFKTSTPTVASPAISAASNISPDALGSLPTTALALPLP